MSSHFQTKSIATDRDRRVFRVLDFAARHGLDEKQERDLLALFGQFATLHELLTNCRLPHRIR
ncbi:hypothetical protein F2982_30325 (plasmid) [Rhizobium sp. BG4]|nr:hypothetical protein F2982_30325 [Rhizobium sp. BG4]